MTYENLFNSFWCLGARCDVMNGMKKICGVVAITTYITDTDCNVLEYYKLSFVFKSFFFYGSCSYNAFTILASVVIHGATP